MTLLWVDGFERYGPAGSTTDPADVLSWKYQADDVNNIYVATGSTGNCLKFTGGLESIVTPALNTTNSTLIVGFALKWDTVSDEAELVNLYIPPLMGSTIGYNGLSARVDLISGNYEISIFIGSSTLLGSSSGVDLQDDTWYYFEMKVYSDASNGSCVAHLDGEEIINFSGEDTQYNNINIYNHVAFREQGGNNLYVDDFYVCDATGNANNDFLGTCNVESLSPSSDVSGNWTPSTGNDLYAMLDETTINSEYISDDTTGNQAIFELDSLSVSGTVAGVAISTESLQSGNLNKYAKLLTQNDAGSVNTTANCMPGRTNPLCHLIPMDKDPDGNDWSSSTINTLRVGVEVS